MKTAITLVLLVVLVAGIQFLSADTVTILLAGYEISMSLSVALTCILILFFFGPWGAQQYCIPDGMVTASQFAPPAATFPRILGYLGALLAGGGAAGQKGRRSPFGGFEKVFAGQSVAPLPAGACL